MRNAKVVVTTLLLLAASSASAAVNVTLSLPDDAPAPLRSACARANGGAQPGACSAAEALKWTAAQFNVRWLEELRGQEALQKQAGFCQKFQAATQPQKDSACLGIGESAGCDPCATR